MKTRNKIKTLKISVVEDIWNNPVNKELPLSMKEIQLESWTIKQVITNIVKQILLYEVDLSRLKVTAFDINNNIKL